MVLLDHLAFGLVMFLTVALTEDRKRRITRLLRDTWTHSRMLMKQAAAEAGRNQSQVQRQIEFKEGSLATLARQPDPWWQWLSVNAACEFGTPKELRRAQQLQRIALRQKRMARMRVVKKARTA